MVKKWPMAYGRWPAASVYLKSAIGDAKVFRLMYFPGVILMTEEFLRAIKAAKLKGFGDGNWGRTDG